MSYFFSWLIVIICFGFLAPGSTMGVKNVLTDERINDLKEKVDGEVMNAEGYWDALYANTGSQFLPVTQLAVDATPKAVVGGLIGLAAHNGPALDNLNSLSNSKDLVKSLVVVFDPRQNVGRGDHKACVEILRKLKRNGVKIYDFADKATSQENTAKSNFEFDGFVDRKGVIEMLADVNFLIVSLCGVTVANERRDNVQNVRSTPKLLEALNVIPHVAVGKSVVLSLNSANGQADNGAWPFANEHHCTHIPTQYWPMGALKTNKVPITRNFIIQSSFLDCLSGSEVEEDLNNLKADDFFKQNGYAEVEYTGL